MSGVWNYVVAKKKKQVSSCTGIMKGVEFERPPHSFRMKPEIKSFTWV